MLPRDQMDRQLILRIYWSSSLSLSGIKTVCSKCKQVCQKSNLSYLESKPVTTMITLFLRLLTQLIKLWLAMARLAFRCSTTHSYKPRTQQHWALPKFSKQLTLVRGSITTKSFSHLVSRHFSVFIVADHVRGMCYSLTQSGIWKLQIQTPFDASSRYWVDQHLGDWQSEDPRQVFLQIPHLRWHFHGRVEWDH